MVQTLIDFISYLFKVIIFAIKNVFGFLVEFFTLLSTKTGEVINLTHTISTGETIEGINIIEFFGAYRWLIGDTLFMFQYALAMVGLFSIVYSLIKMIWDFMTSEDRFTNGSGIQKIFGKFIRKK